LGSMDCSKSRLTLTTFNCTCGDLSRTKSELSCS
jgi:hypothetical protein